MHPGSVLQMGTPKPETHTPAITKAKFQKIEKYLTKITLIPRVLISIVFEVLALIAVSPALLIKFATLQFKKLRPDAKPTTSKINKLAPPILLIHGAGINDAEFIIAKLFFAIAKKFFKKSYGHVFSLDYAGFLSNDPKLGIDDYAKGKVAAKIAEIKALTGQNEIILIGHSMGGLIASYYAEQIAHSNSALMQVKHAITIATPWHGAPVVNFVHKHLPQWLIPSALKGKHMDQMSVSDNTKDTIFRETLVFSAETSYLFNNRTYYNIYSTIDAAVPEKSGLLNNNIAHQRSFNYLGHNGLVASPRVWKQVGTWLDEIYKKTGVES